MEQIRKFLHGKGFALALLACLLAAAAAGIWAVRTVRDELEKNLTDLAQENLVPQTGTEAEDRSQEEEELWLDLTEEAANSLADVPQSTSAAQSSSSGVPSGSGTVSEPSALHTDSAPAADSAASASVQPFPGRVLNAYSGDELVFNRTLGDWRTHNGVDYACAAGERVCSPAAGRVTDTATEDRWGGVVSIEDSAGRLWRVCGVAEPAVEPGETVTAGQLLGTVGSIDCECAEEDHIHLEVMQNEHWLDPAGILH